MPKKTGYTVWAISCQSYVYWILVCIYIRVVSHVCVYQLCTAIGCNYWVKILLLVFHMHLLPCSDSSTCNTLQLGNPSQYPNQPTYPTQQRSGLGDDDLPFLLLGSGYYPGTTLLAATALSGGKSE